MPTLMVLPDAADVAAVVAAGDAELPEIGGALEHAFNKMLPVAAEPKIRNSRRRNRFVIFSYFAPHERIETMRSNQV